MKFALVRRRAGEDTALHSTAVSTTGPIYPPLGNYVPSKAQKGLVRPSNAQ